MWFNHEQITTDGDLDTIANLQRDMKFGTPRKLSCKVSWVDSSPESSRAYSKTSLGGSGGTHLMGLGHGASRGAARCCPWPWPLPEDGKILHRDISKNNIIIIEFPAKEAPKGRLIDLDLAKELDSMTRRPGRSIVSPTWTSASVGKSGSGCPSHICGGSRRSTL